MSFDASNIPVEEWPIENLIPYEFNHKKHTQTTIEARAISIADVGVEQPIAVEEDGTIISGHGRRLSLLHLGKKFAPVRVFRGITKAQANKLRIASNKAVSNEYDTDILAAELRKIMDEGGTLDGIGLTDKEVTTMLGDIGEIDLGSMSDDITLDVGTHEAGIKEAATKADEATVRLEKVFGFKTVTSDQARVITRWLGEVEAKYTDLKGADAMIAHMGAETANV
jgi:hypothetical protein